MSEQYVLAVRRLRWLMDAGEDRLEKLSDNSVITPDGMRSWGAPRRGSLDEVGVAVDAWESLGVLRRMDQGLAVRLARLHETSGFRRGVRAGIDSQVSDDDRVRLWAALPSDLPLPVATPLRDVTEDLRAGLVDLATSATYDLALVSPFWDAETLDELRPILRHRLAAGVTVKMLGRFGPTTPMDVRVILQSLQKSRYCTILSWYEPSLTDPFGTRTFHLKAAVADGGKRTYLGTANFTMAGLRSRLELGVQLTGQPGYHLAAVVRTVLSLGRPIDWGRFPPVGDTEQNGAREDAIR